MTADERKSLLRLYAAGEVTWSALQRRGIESYRDVLAGLGEMELRPPVAPLDGRGAEARRKGRAAIRRALANTPG